MRILCCCLKGIGRSKRGISMDKISILNVNTEKGSYESNQMRKNYPLKIVPHEDIIAMGYDHVIHHWHRSLELVFAGDTQFDIWVNGITKHMSSGEVTIVNNGEMHGLYGITSSSRSGCSVLISYRFLREIHPQIDHLWFEINDRAEVMNEISAIMVRMKEIYQQEGDWYNLKLRSEMYSLIYILFTKCSKKTSQEVVESYKTAEMYKEIITYVNDHCSENIKMNQVAQHFGYNSDYFSRNFKNYVGESFTEYLRSRRIYNARKELVHTDKSIMDIAVDNGFCDSKAFIRDFKTSLGMTPLKYRKWYQNTHSNK